jgi:hypothetical protein
MRQPTYRPGGGDARPASHVAAAALVVGEGQHTILVAEEEGIKIGQQRGEPWRSTLPSRAPPHGPVTKGRRGDVEDLPFHGAGHTHPVLLPRASVEGETWEEEQRWRLGFEGTREWHGRGRKGEKK